MANYVSSLTGSQIDSVMQKIDQGVPEGWAVGEKNGVPVSSSSVYYHNNAKYYAESSQASAARAEAAVPPSTAGAVFFDRSQSLTDAQMRQAKKNIGAGSTNPNLLDNGWFLVNTRGVTSGATNNKIYQDRWNCSYGTTQGTWSWDENGVTITGSTGGAFETQRLGDDVLAFITGKVVTGSVMLSNGTISSGTFTKSGTAGQEFFRTDDYWLFFNTANTIALRVNSGKTVTVRAIKLELGAVSTLANDSIPTYNEELVKCITSKANTTDRFTNMVVTATSNRNLLDNWWFGSTVINQRGITTKTLTSTQTYYIDRWIGAINSGGAGTLTVSANGLKFDSITSPGCYIFQRIETVASLDDKVLTASVLMSDGTIYSGSLKRTNGTSQDFYNDNGVTLRMGSGNGFNIIAPDRTIEVKAVKLEEGAVSTLYLDAAPNPAEELAKCQRYFFRLNSQTNVNVLGFGNGGNGVAIFLIPTPTTMRATPTVATTNVGNLQIIIAGTSYTPTAISIRNVQANGIMITATCSSVSGSDLALLRATASGATLDFSAEL